MLSSDSNRVVREAAGDVAFVCVDHVLPVLVGHIIAGVDDQVSERFLGQGEHVVLALQESFAHLLLDDSPQP